LKVGRVKFAVKEIKFKNTTAIPMETDHDQKIARERLFGLAANAPMKTQQE
jgi:hypothetical protein